MPPQADMPRLLLLCDESTPLGAVIRSKFSALGYCVIEPPNCSKVGSDLCAAMESETRDQRRACDSLPVSLDQNRHGIDVLIHVLSFSGDSGNLELRKQIAHDMTLYRGGRIINIAPFPSQTGFVENNPDTFVDLLANASGNHIVTINTITPGCIGNMDDMADRQGMRRSDRAESRRAICQANAEKLAEIASLAAYLASGEAGTINRANFTINMGRYLS